MSAVALRPEGAYIVIKVLITMILGLTSVVVVYTIGAFSGVEMTPVTWVLTGFLAWAASFVFATFGLFMGYLLPAENVMQAIGPVLGIFSLFGGLFIPVSLLPLGLLAPTDSPPVNRPAIVVLTAYDYPQYADAALRMGAVGFVLKTAPLGEILAAIRLAAVGGLAFGVRPSGSGSERPTARELDVVRLVVDGCSNDEIGARTVETHLRRLFERFAIASRTERATRALREGWLEIPPS